MTEAVCVLGSTGSIGVSTLDVIARHTDRFRINALSGRSNTTDMLAQCKRFEPERVVMVDPEAAEIVALGIKDLGLRTSVGSGPGELDKLAAECGETVVCGIVGSAGLGSTLAAVEAGHKVLVANKEPLVMLGGHLVEAAREHGAILLPLDSEHNAIFQCLPQIDIREQGGFAQINDFQGIRRILLTGSGGPLRTTPLDELQHVTPDQACRHPNWNMGRKISVDSATMMNKGLELIEACMLFGVQPDQVEIVIHPQSIIHSMVEYIDGSVIAQMGAPDMRVPIANALAWPERIESGSARLSFREIARFDFEAPDNERFPALELSRWAAERQGTLPAIMNAANEIAVQAFLDKHIQFTRIVQSVAEIMEMAEVEDDSSMDCVLAADSWARQACAESLGLGSQAS